MQKYLHRLFGAEKLEVINYKSWFWVALVGTFIYMIVGMLVMLTGLDPVTQGEYLAMIQLPLTILFSLVTVRILKGTLNREDFGLEKLNIKKVLLYGILGFIVCISFSSLVTKLFPYLLQASKDVGNSFSFGKSNIKDLCLILGIAALGPLTEEIVFRGLIFRSIRDGLSKYKKISIYVATLTSALVSSFIFLSIHGGAGQDQQMPFLFAMSLIFTFAYVLSGNLYVPVLMHSINNAFGVFMIIKNSNGTIKFFDNTIAYIFLCIAPFVALLVLIVIRKFLKKS